MTRGADDPLKLGIVWRGDRGVASPLPRADRQLGPLFEVFAERSVIIVPIPFADDSLNEVREELLGCDGALVWVNPIQDGATRAHLDALLRDVSAQGVFVSAHPDVIDKLGTKEVLVRTRELGWGSDAALYGSSADLQRRFPARLDENGRLVLKQARGNGGNGVWSVELVEEHVPGGPGRFVRVRDARSRDGSSAVLSLEAFMDRCDDYFAWSGSLVDQPYQKRLAEGMLRCYFTHDEVVGFAQQWPQGLLMLDSREPPVESPASIVYGADDPFYETLRVKVEDDWVPQMMTILDLDREALPVIWDADFLYGPKDASGQDTYVLCEINVSAVWPFPPTAVDAIVTATLRRVEAARIRRS
ncbi:MAG TPA: Cj0069 family protein [Acidimicrobiales bacterium]|nr:MAG: hypothetical protein B7X07_01250 [Actinobacteria bacterium 21-64-8]HQT99187.1 Cj0069 family protein [Acidimicrobiales bacterium]